MDRDLVRETTALRDIEEQCCKGSVLLACGDFATQAGEQQAIAAKACGRI
ncbi:hypothetical protein LBMAG49_08410 [Planctomycetota bacterium]|nr:hypothetical protein LBMAG49_08410 [Planctomycetota bacterium]